MDLLQKLLNVPPAPAPESGSHIVPHAGQQLVSNPPHPPAQMVPMQGQMVIQTDRGALMLLPQQQLMLPSFQEELGPEGLASTAMMAVIMLCVVMMMQTLSHSMMMRRLL
jgi:hypothetical protein